MGIRLNVMTAGDTWNFTVAAPDYPAGTWTLSLYLVPRFTAPVQSPITLTSSPDADDPTLHRFAVAAGVTAAYAAGAYGYYTTATDGAQRFTLEATEWSGEAQILADPSGLAQGHDGRSDAQVALDQARAAYYTFVGSNGTIAEYEIAGRRMKYSSASDISRHISALELEVARERRAEAIRRGLADPRKVYTRAYRA